MDRILRHSQRKRGETAMPDLTPPRQSPTLHDRIQGALANLGHRVSDTTVGNILKAHGIEPAPRRKHQTTWKTFIKAPIGYSLDSSSHNR